MSMNKREFLESKITNFKQFLKESDCPDHVFEQLLNLSDTIPKFIHNIRTHVLPYQSDLKGIIVDFANYQGVSLADVKEETLLKIERYLKMFCDVC